MKRFLATIAMGALLSTGGGLAGQVKKREKRQQKRIDDGVASGELTKKETLKIEKKEAKLHRKIEKNRKDGPGLTPKERAKANKAQNQLSKEIYKQKHDDQKRDGNSEAEEPTP
jgi:aminoglycoside phosphotransferase family enzyme